VLKSPWVVAVVAVVVVVLLVGVFVKAGNRLLHWLHQPIEPGKPRWTYALTPLAAALTPLAAFSVLLPSYFSQQRSDSKFMVEAERSRTDAQWQRARLDTEAWDAQFRETQARFGNPNDQTRAIAALQLADLATAPKPTAEGDAASDANYPRFRPVCVQLAVALPMEQNAGARTAQLAALQKLAAFAKEKKNAAWQRSFANQLADANRQTARTFTDALARYAAANDASRPQTLAVLATVAPFTPDPVLAQTTLTDFMAASDFQAGKRIGVRLREAATGEQRRTGDALLLASVRNRATHLADTRDALANALRALDAPPPAPGVVADRAAKALPSLPNAPALPQLASPASAPAQTPERLRLQNCFLAGADLRGAFLHNADLSGANLTGANLVGANLVTANPVVARRLPPSVTKAVFASDDKELATLRRQYPRYSWSAVTKKEATDAPPVVNNAQNVPGPVERR